MRWSRDPCWDATKTLSCPQRLRCFTAPHASVIETVLERHLYLSGIALICSIDSAFWSGVVLMCSYFWTRPGSQLFDFAVNSLDRDDKRAVVGVNSKWKQSCVVLWTAGRVTFEPALCPVDIAYTNHHQQTVRCFYTCSWASASLKATDWFN